MAFSKTSATIAAGLVASLSALALFNVFRTRQVERGHPPNGQFVSVDGCRLHYVAHGEGSPIVLIHGNVVTTDDFSLSGVMDRLVSKGHRVVAFDRPGYGHSDRPRGKAWTAAQQADLLQKAFDRLDIKRPIVVGHSWGTLVALALALDHPNSVSGLVLVSGYYYPSARIDAPVAAMAAIPVLGDLIRYTVDPLLGAALLPGMLKVMFSPRDVPEEFAQRFPYGLPVRPSQIRAEAQDAAAMIPSAFAMHEHYPEIHVPVALIAGAEDKVVNVEQSERLAKDIPHSSLTIVPDAGHMVHYAVAAEVADAIELVGVDSAAVIGSL